MPYEVYSSVDRIVMLHDMLITTRFAQVETFNEHLSKLFNVIELKKVFCSVNGKYVLHGRKMSNCHQYMFSHPTDYCNVLLPVDIYLVAFKVGI